VSGFELGDRPRATPAGTYRFVVEGARREGGRRVPYRLESAAFRVLAWDGVTADDLRAEPGGVSFAPGPRRTIELTTGGPPVTAVIGPIDYPDSYDDPQRPRFIREQRTAMRDPAAPADPSRIEWFCFTCSFRPWLDAGNLATATVTYVLGGRVRARVSARPQGDRWVAGRVLGAGESAFVASGCARDAWGNHNGAPSAVIGPPVPANVVQAAACR
jgi:hypothetical protein